MLKILVLLNVVIFYDFTIVYNFKAKPKTAHRSLELILTCFDS